MPNITVKLKALPDGECIACNYRTKDKAWERGKVNHTEVKFRADGSYYAIYTVMLHRKSLHVKGHFNPIFLHVGDDGIEQV